MYTSWTQNNNASFTSKIFITDYQRSVGCVKAFYESKDFLNQAKKLVNNGNDDIVVFRTGQNGIYMTVKDSKNVSWAKLIYNPFDNGSFNKEFGSSIKKAYESCINLELKLWAPHGSRIPELLKEYIIS